MSNPLLPHAKLPGRVFQLPSKGLFYEKGVLAPHVVNAEVQIHPLSAMAEMKLRSPDLLFSGRAIREVCEECVPDILLPEKLLSRDVDAIFCFLRIATYGASMTVKSYHGCQGATTNEYVVDLDKIIMSPNNSCLEHKDMLYRVKLPNGQVANLRPITFMDTVESIHGRRELEEDAEQNKGTPSPKLMEQMMVKDLLALIASVETTVQDNGVEKTLLITDVNMIGEWIRSIQRSAVDAILLQSRKANDWGFKLVTKLLCRDCGQPYDHDLELDPITFFSG